MHENRVFSWNSTHILKEIKSITKELREGVKSFAETRREDFVRPERESKHFASINLLQSRLTHLRWREPGYLNFRNWWFYWCHKTIKCTRILHHGHGDSGLNDIQLSLELHLWNRTTKLNNSDRVFSLYMVCEIFTNFSPFLKENYSLIYVLASSFEINMLNWAVAWFKTVQNTKRTTKYDHVVERREAIHAMFTV